LSVWAASLECGLDLTVLDFVEASVERVDEVGAASTREQVGAVEADQVVTAGAEDLVVALAAEAHFLIVSFDSVDAAQALYVVVSSGAVQSVAGVGAQALFPNGVGAGLTLDLQRVGHPRSQENRQTYRREQ